MQYRQGDVFLVRVEAIPAGAMPVARERGWVVLAHGEVTGHRHAIADPAAQLFDLPEAEVEDRFLRIVGTDALLEHEEHHPIALAPGVYRVVRQREYAPAPRTAPERSRTAPRWTWRSHWDVRPARDYRRVSD